MIVNFPRIHVKKSSELESLPISSMSSISSFQKPEYSKDSDRVVPNQIQTKAQIRRSKQQRKKGTNTNQIKRSCLKSLKNPNSSATSLSGTDPRTVKTVSFEKTARVRRVRPRNHFTKEEQEDMWYNDNDYSEIKRRAVETVKKMLKGEKSGGFVDDNNYTSRGLECRMKKNAVERKEFKAFARSLVLEEQEDQNQKGIICSGRLRKVYLKASSISSVKAQSAGRKDAEAVNDIDLYQLLRIINL